jgi:uncharacterized membrane protein
MNAILLVTALWLAFAGTHVGLSTRGLRTRLVSRLGEWGFRTVFSIVAAITFAALIHGYGVVRMEGPPGPALGASDLARALLMACIGFGLALAGGALYSYPSSPYAPERGVTREPRGLARITRHPFFVGLAIVGAAHALLATRLVGSVFFGLLAVYAIAGALHQDRKLLALRGKAYVDFVAQTSLVPFAAVATGRQRVVWHELPWIPLAGGVLFAWFLREVHASILSYGGAWVIGAVVGGGSFLLLQGWRRSVRATSSNRPLGPAAAGTGAAAKR